jgi:hypothetical protein
MSTKLTSTPYSELPKILYLFLQLLTIGGFVSIFLVTYLTFDPALFASRLMVLENWIFNLLLTAIISVTIYFLFIGSDLKIAAGESHSLSKFVFGTFYYLLFISLLIFTHLFRLLNGKSHYLYLLTFLGGISALYMIIKGYTFSSGRECWHHPTTAGSIFQGTITLGGILVLWTFPQPALQHTISWLLLIVLIIEGLTLWSRFKFLSTTSQATRRAAQMMLGSHLTLFGIRFIFGIITPAVYLGWTIMVNPLPIHPILFMILIGEFSERILFFISSDKISTLNSDQSI